MGKVLRYNFKYLLGLVCVFTFSSFLVVEVNVLNKYVVNSLVEGTNNGYLGYIFAILLASYLVVWLIAKFIGYMEAFANNLFRLKVDVFMEKILMKKIVCTKQEAFYDPAFMDKYTFVCKNTNKASTVIFNTISVLFSNIAIIASSAVFFIRYEPLLLLYMVFVFVINSVNACLTAKIGYKTSKEQVNEKRLVDYFSGLFVNKSSVKEMRIYQFFDSIYAKWEQHNTRYVEKQIAVKNKQICYSNCVNIALFLMRVAAIFILLTGTKQGKYDVGTFVMLFGLSETGNNGIKSLTDRIFSGVVMNNRYFKDYYDIVAPMTGKEIKEALRVKPDSDVALCCGDFKKLEADHLSYAYPTVDHNAVSDVSISISKGEIISILGYNGSGKTTLSKMLYGALEPRQGNVKINNVNVTDYTREEIFKYFGIAPQEYALFSVSIHDNVGLGCIEKMDDPHELELAYSKANLDRIINKYGNKDNTVIGKEYDPDGIDLSGGEKQHIVLAAAYMGSPEIILLDEPTASIDPLKECEMLNDFREILSGKTAILISHRIGFARLADRILIMKDGAVVEEGTHDELLAKQGYYCEMFNKQKELYE